MEHNTATDSQGMEQMPWQDLTYIRSDYREGVWCWHEQEQLSPASGGVQQLQALVCAVQGSAAAAAIWSQSSGGSATHDATEV